MCDSSIYAYNGGLNCANGLFCETDYSMDYYYYGWNSYCVSSGMSAEGIAWLTIFCVLFVLVLPIVFFCLKAKGRAKLPTVDFSMYTNPSDTVDVNTAAGPYTQQMFNQPSYKC